MGLFISNCPKCERTINWFLTVPENYVCKCGQRVTPEEIRESWHANYFAHLDRSRQQEIKVLAERIRTLHSYLIDNHHAIRLSGNLTTEGMIYQVLKEGGAMVNTSPGSDPDKGPVIMHPEMFEAWRRIVMASSGLANELGAPDAWCGDTREDV